MKIIVNYKLVSGSLSISDQAILYHFSQVSSTHGWYCTFQDLDSFPLYLFWVFDLIHFSTYWNHWILLSLSSARIVNRWWALVYMWLHRVRQAKLSGTVGDASISRIQGFLSFLIFFAHSNFFTKIMKVLHIDVYHRIQLQVSESLYTQHYQDNLYFQFLYVFG